MKHVILVIMQVASALLFIFHAKTNQASSISWVVPLSLLILMAINSVWFTRFVSWLIFAGSFFCLLVLLSAFTLRWRLETAFEAVPFYRAMLMYVLFIYVSLGQIKILGGTPASR